MEKTSKIRIACLLFFIICISLLHYLTPLHLHYLHDIFQRLYYLPIILAALWFGLRGGLLCSIVVSIVYAPHILFQWGGEMDVEMEKYLEILLYNIVGGVTGLLSQREREKTVELGKTAHGLRESCEKLRQQSERIIVIEEQLRRSERMSSLGEMAAALAHEIRNPLGSIRGTAEILRDDYRPGDPKHEFLEIQIRETERLNRVVEDFLRLARPRPVDMKPCSLGDELEMIEALVAGEARKRGISLKFEMPETPVVIRADGEKLRQAFLNIVINALQATPAGGSVAVSTVLAPPGYCEIRFRDSGEGIDAEVMPKVYEPFFTTKPDGAGLGLAIVRKIVENQGGAIEIRSAMGEGTTVAVRLPLPEEEPA